MNSSLTTLSVRLTVQSRFVQREADRHRRTVAEAKSELDRAAKRRDEVAVARAARKQVNAKRMHEMYSRISIDLDHAASMVKTAALAGRITTTMRDITAQLVSAAGTMDVAQIDTVMHEFNRVMAATSSSTALMESSLGSLGCSAEDQEVIELIKQASDVAGIELCSQFIRPPRTSEAASSVPLCEEDR
jgi:hypothetical protein